MEFYLFINFLGLFICLFFFFYFLLFIDLLLFVFFSMVCIERIPMGSSIVSVTLSPDEICFIVALANGSVSIVVVEEHAQLTNVSF